MQETTRGQGTSDAGLSVQATEVEAGKGKAENQTRVTRAEFIDAYFTKMVNVANEAMSEPHCVKSTVLKHYYLKHAYPVATHRS